MISFSSSPKLIAVQLVCADFAFVDPERCLSGSVDERFDP
jgi:hypothetical protein